MGCVHVGLHLDHEGRRTVTTTGPHGVIRYRHLSPYQWRRMAHHLGRRPRVVEFLPDLLSIRFTHEEG
jgi:hypothetical protein